MLKSVGHIGIAVKNIEVSLKAISKALDLPVPRILDYPDKKMKVAVIDFKGVGLEFIEDYSEDGAFASFVKERGNAIHHVCLLSDDMEEDLEILEKRGVELADRKPKMGLRGKRIAFTEASILDGIPFELSEP
jgi:methylmalonyl-CoA epimerase